MTIPFAEFSVIQIGEHNGPQISTFGVSSLRFSRHHAIVAFSRYVPMSITAYTHKTRPPVLFS